MKSLRRPQKEKERILFDRLNELLELHTSCIEQPDPPDPDIFANIGNNKTGIDCKGLFRPYPRTPFKNAMVIRYVGFTPVAPKLPEARVLPVNKGLSEA